MWVGLSQPIKGLKLRIPKVGILPLGANIEILPEPPACWSTAQIINTYILSALFLWRILTNTNGICLNSFLLWFIGHLRFFCKLFPTFSGTCKNQSVSAEATNQWWIFSPIAGAHSCNQRNPFCNSNLNYELKFWACTASSSIRELQESRAWPVWPLHSVLVMAYGNRLAKASSKGKHLCCCCVSSWVFLAEPRSSRGLSSLTREWTQAMVVKAPGTGPPANSQGHMFGCADVYGHTDSIAPFLTWVTGPGRWPAEPKAQKKDDTPSWALFLCGY